MKNKKETKGHKENSVVERKNIKNQKSSHTHLADHKEEYSIVLEIDQTAMDQGKCIPAHH